MLDDATRNGDTVVMTKTSHPEIPMCHSGKSKYVSITQSRDKHKLTPDTDTERCQDGPEDELWQVSDPPTKSVYSYAIVNISRSISSLPPLKALRKHLSNIPILPTKSINISKSEGHTKPTLFQE